ncbi:MAG: rRNA maturation RNase YbeY [Epsilonproteobacteria bacterium]|nr:MAG: rRNA maturation RNase YbeY [Campylobacterota bacterium]
MFNIVFENETSYKIDKEFLNNIAKAVSDKEIEFILTNNAEIQEINLTTRGIDKPTDVLSFPYDEMPNTPLGSIVISADFVKEKSEQYNHSFNDELSLLFIHGMLHLVGYDHEVDNGEHREKEEEIIKKFNLPDSLIVRNS